MSKLQVVTAERRVVRRGPAFRSSRDFQRHVESEIAFRITRAGNAVPGRKSWREKKVRSGARVPCRLEFETFRAVLERAAADGDPAILAAAMNEVQDAMVEFIRLTTRLMTDARAQVAQRERQEQRDQPYAERRAA